MKKLLVVLLAVGLGVVSEAQPRINQNFKGSILKDSRSRGDNYKGNIEYVRPRVTIITSVAPLNPYYSYGPRYNYRFSQMNSPFYSPFNDPFYTRREIPERPSQLDLQVEDIKNEYKYQIDTVKDDKSISKDERKQKVRDLKHRRDDEIIDAKKSYYQAEEEKDDRS